MTSETLLGKEVSMEEFKTAVYKVWPTGKADNNIALILLFRKP